MNSANEFVAKLSLLKHLAGYLYDCNDDVKSRVEDVKFQMKFVAHMLPIFRAPLASSTEVTTASQRKFQNTTLY
jgi:hypothetical protein